MNPRVEFVSHVRDLVGEGPVWDAREQALYWVDSLKPVLRRLHPATGAERVWPLPSPIGSFALAEPGSLLVALRDGFHALDLDSGETRPLALPEADDLGVRFNDGRMDRGDGFVCGTLRTEIREIPAGKLYRFGPDGRVDVLATQLSIANAVCFSPDGLTLYYTDSLQEMIWACPYDPLTGSAGERRVFTDVRALTGSGADGAVTDSEGGLWVALPQVGKVGRFAQTGVLDALIDTPTPYPSCPAFGGPALDVLYVTSLSDSGPRVPLAPHPEAGKLIAIHGLGVTGIEEPRFSLGALAQSGTRS